MMLYYNVKHFRGLSVCRVHHLLVRYTHTHWPTREVPHLIMAGAGSLPFEFSFSISILHLLRDGHGGRLTPLPRFRDDGIRENTTRSPPPPQLMHHTSPAMHNRKEPFDRFCMGAHSHAWRLDRDPWNLIHKSATSHCTKSPLWFSYPMQKWASSCQMTHTFQPVCIFIPLILEVCNICLFREW